MWFVQPKEDYVSKIPWKHDDKPAVMSWQIRARDYNTFVANIALIPIVLIAAGMGYIVSLMAETLTFTLLAWGGW